MRGFVEAIGTVRGAPKVVCIGPVTAKEARAHGLTVHAVARPTRSTAWSRPWNARAPLDDPDEEASTGANGGAESDVAGTLTR